tara:strand:+ start:1185 stop:1592 length:408 start_codon:yes stop_codon:yes gene_type:complete
MNIFPTYPNTSGSYVSQRRINKLKPKVIEILENKQAIILKAFQQLSARYSRPPVIQLHVEEAIQKVMNARVTGESGEMHGESDDYRIWIPKNKANDTLLFGTLLHESLHYICTFNGKDICSKDEHYVMRLLGDDC